MASLQTLLGEDEAGGRSAASAKALEQKLVAIEESLFQMRVTGRGQDLLRYPSRLVEKLVYSVDGLSVADFPPTKSSSRCTRCWAISSRESARGSTRS